MLRTLFREAGSLHAMEGPWPVHQPVRDLLYTAARRSLRSRTDLVQVWINPPARDAAEHSSDSTEETDSVAGEEVLH